MSHWGPWTLWVLWPYGYLAFFTIWLFGSLALWPFGPLALWPFGPLALWPFGLLALYIYILKLVSFLARIGLYTLRMTSLTTPYLVTDQWSVGQDGCSLLLFVWF
jgi:hypothetical protein